MPQEPHDACNWSDFSKEAGRCQEDSSSFFASLNLFLRCRAHSSAKRSNALSLDGFFPSSIVINSTRLAQTRVASSLRCCPPTISSVIADHDGLCELPFPQGRRVA